MRHVRLSVLLLIVWALFGGSAFATVAGAENEAIGPVNTTPKHTAIPTKGPIVVNWHFKDGSGSVKLIVHSDGKYDFSGDYKRSELYRILGVSIWMIAANHYNTAVEYRREVSGVPAGGLRWSKHGRSVSFFKDHFQSFAMGVWYGQLRLMHSGPGYQQLYQETKTCEEWKKDWRPALPGLDELVGPPKYCYKLNIL